MRTTRTARRTALSVMATAMLVLGGTAAAGAAVIQNAPEIVPAVVVDTHGAEAVEPETILLSPADSNDAVNFISWWVWNDETAVGTGVKQVNLCQPTCAEGTVISQSVVVELGDPVGRGQGKPAEFTSAKVTTPDGTRSIDLGQIAVMPVV